VTRPATKLLIYSADFWPTVGGIQSIVMTLARGLARPEQSSQTIQCTVVTETPAGKASDSDLPFGVVRKPSLIELARLLWQSDLVHVAGPALRPLLLSFVLRKKVVVEHHGLHAVCPNALLFHEATGTACPGHFLAGRHRECWKCNAGAGYWRSLRLWALTFARRWFCQLTAANIAPTRWLERFLKLPRTFTIPHGVPESPGLPFDSVSKPKLAFVGRLVNTKGVDLLFHASREVLNRGLDFGLLIIGDGPERGHLERLCGELRLADRVQFVGEVSNSDLQSVLLRDAIAVVVPSVSGEAFGLAAAENMMRGRAVIVPQGGSLAEVAGATGLEFGSADVPSLAGCMEEMLRSPELAKELGRRARQQARIRFAAADMLQNHLALYREVLK
jgi:glycogen(starch) synthase